MKYYIIAGEASGDLHGSHLMRELKKKDPDAEFRVWGGDRMKAQGATLVRHYRDLAFMGFTEVLLNLRTIFRNLRYCKEDILSFSPDALILIDYPGFNLRIAKWASKQEIFQSKKSRIIFYISPQVWAWKENRVPALRDSVDRMLVILPFEKKYYREKWNWEVEYVGHPLVEEIDARLRDRVPADDSDSPLVALLPGSRKQEIMKKLPVMLETTRRFPGCRFVVAKAPGADEDFYSGLLHGFTNVSSVSDQTYDLLSKADAALVTSGTATLETALFGVPEVVCYKGSWLSYQIGKRLVKVKFISLVNLIMDRLVVKELIQDDLTVENLERELNSLLHDKSRREQLIADYRELKSLLREGGPASENAARSIYQLLAE